MLDLLPDFSPLVPGALAAAEPSTWRLVAEAGAVVKLVIVILLLASIVSWGIILMKYRQLRASARNSEAFQRMFWDAESMDAVYQKSKKFQDGAVTHVFRAGYIELAKLKKNRPGDPTSGGTFPEELRGAEGLENIGRALRRASSEEVGRMERYLSFLATTGSTAPFVGLFGTVWGIMDSFQAIGVRQSVGLDVVAPGISEALIATAFGLAAAIPAVVAYNAFVTRVRRITADMDNFAADFLNIIERHFI